VVPMFELILVQDCYNNINALLCEKNINYIVCSMRYYECMFGTVTTDD
jgi:hypothetical protein